ncbi:MAG: hypothetical protein M3N35_12285, partial [Candidatus Binatota bacterium]|nr:hypothetical protein [Candidatus Binatota bacterium]
AHHFTTGAALPLPSGDNLTGDKKPVAAGAETSFEPYVYTSVMRPGLICGGRDGQHDEILC